MKKTIFLTWAIVAFSLITTAFALSACQATPTQEAVVNKSEDFFEKLTESTDAFYTAPDAVEQQANVHGLDLKFNAKVVMPISTGFRVVEIEQVHYTIDDCKRFMDYFEPGATWIQQPVDTKADVRYRMFRIENSNRFDEYEKQEYRKTFESELEAAPESVDFVPANVDTFSDSKVTPIWSLHEDGSRSFFSMRLSGDYVLYKQGVESGIYQRDNFLPSDIEYNDFTGDPLISEADALKIAQKAMDDLNLAPELTLLSSEKGIAYQFREPVARGWLFIYTRMNGGLQAPYDFFGYVVWGASPAPSHIGPWDQEALLIFVADEGIYCFDLRGAGREVKKLYDNVQLLPFSDLLERIQEQLVYQHSYHDESIESVEVQVSTISLISSLIDIADKPGYGLLIPSWKVEYQLTLTYKDKEAKIEKVDLSTIFNAVDGSYIEPRKTKDIE